MRRVAFALVFSLLASAAFITTYFVYAAQTQLEGGFLAASFAGFCLGLLWWSKKLVGSDLAIDERQTLVSPEQTREAAVGAFAQGVERVFDRRGWLKALSYASFVTLGLAALLPFRSLGPAPGRKLFHTAWRRGVRLVREDGKPVHRDELEAGSFLTVFPEGVTQGPDTEAMADSAALLIAVEPDFLRLPPKRLAWAPGGLVAYSKVCTHAGCPVGLYRKSTHQLLCPCHQSTFDVLDGAVPVFGPAPRPLPQLPLEVDRDGYLRALGDFSEAIGPTFWERSARRS